MIIVIRVVLLLLVAVIIVFGITIHFQARAQPIPVSQGKTQVVYLVSKFEPHLLELERAALDEAFKQKITSLWTIWMSDDHGQPARAINGAAQARKAYIASMTEIERRENEYRR